MWPAIVEASAAAAGDPLTTLNQYGPLGVVVVLLVLYARGSIKRDNDRADKAEAQVKELNEFIRTELEGAPVFLHSPLQLFQQHDRQRFLIEQLRRQLEEEER